MRLPFCMLTVLLVVNVYKLAELCTAELCTGDCSLWGNSLLLILFVIYYVAELSQRNLIAAELYIFS